MASDTRIATDRSSFCRVHKKGPSPLIQILLSKDNRLTALNGSRIYLLFPSNPSDECDDRRAVKGETNEHNRFREHQQALV
jgi:hypothetical protein